MVTAVACPLLIQGLKADVENHAVVQLANAMSLWTVNRGMFFLTSISYLFHSPHNFSGVFITLFKALFFHPHLWYS